MRSTIWTLQNFSCSTSSTHNKTECCAWGGGDRKTATMLNTHNQAWKYTEVHLYSNMKPAVVILFIMTNAMIWK